MAREATITQEDVNAVADRIRALGTKPTARAVRESLGGGSMATVLRLLQVWQAGQVSVPSAPPALPLALQKALVDFIGQEVAAAKAGIEDDLAAARQASADLIAESERQAAALEVQGENIDRLHAEKAELVGRSAQLTSDLEIARDDAESLRQQAETARTDLAKLQLKLEGVPRLEAEIARLQAALDTERGARVVAEQAAAVSAAKLEQVVLRADDLQARLLRAEAEGREMRQEAATLRHRTDAQQEALDVASRECDRAKDAARRAEDVAAELRGQITELRAGAPTSKD